MSTSIDFFNGQHYLFGLLFLFLAFLAFVAGMTVSTVEDDGNPYGDDERHRWFRFCMFCAVAFGAVAIVSLARAFL